MMHRHELQKQIGQQVGTSDWFTIDQPQIDAFAQLTHDPAPLHTDPEYAAKTAIGTTIAHGFHTLSLLSAMAYQVLEPLKGQTLLLNYGFDRVRFITPVPNGARIRAHFTLTKVNEPKPRQLNTTYDVSVEIDGQARPALVATWLHRRAF